MSELATKITEIADTFKTVREDHGTRLSELERKWAREPANDNYVAANDNNSLAAALLDSKEIKDLTSTFRGRAVVKIQGERADITSSNTTVGAGRSSGTSLVPGMRVPGILAPFNQRLTIRDLCTQIRTTSNSVEWARETGFTNNARPVTETTTKPKSDLEFNLLTSPVRTIAHFFKISTQMLSDVPLMASYIGARGTHGLKLKEEAQLLTGNGTGQNLNGIVPQATAFSPAFTTVAEQAFDRVNQALGQVELASAVPDAVVLHPSDWRAMLGIKNGQEDYISQQSPFGLQEQRLWNVPTVTSLSMAPGEFLVGQFANNAMIFDRWDVEVRISTENSDDFERNLASVLVESRLAFALTSPEAMVSGDLSVST